MTPAQRIIHFLTYNNAAMLALAILLLGGGTVLAASETAREAVLGSAVETVVSIDNSAILALDTATFDPHVRITEVQEDDTHYFVAYAYDTFAPVDGAWQGVEKEGVLSVPKDAVTAEGLESYVAEQLREVAAHETTYLARLQEAERAKGAQEKRVARSYTGLRGLIIAPTVEEVVVTNTAFFNEEPFEPMDDPAPTEPDATTIPDPDAEETTPTEDGHDTLPEEDEDTVADPENDESEPLEEEGGGEEGEEAGEQSAL